MIEKFILKGILFTVAYFLGLFLLKNWGFEKTVIMFLSVLYALSVGVS